MKRHRSIPIPLGIPFAFVAAIAFTSRIGRADPRSTKAGAPSDDGYGYVFTDDVMQAGVLGPAAPPIAIVVHASRQQLIRPRTAFVRELLKTVENL
ncbi:MAG TPA: hypothetical protein VEK07_09910 [Polyangiaceae bacterium]|nr:hypothetical protein [Polyangiaceae bacterium]